MYDTPKCNKNEYVEKIISDRITTKNIKIKSEEGSGYEDQKEYSVS